MKHNLSSYTAHISGHITVSCMHAQLALILCQFHDACMQVPECWPGKHACMHIHAHHHHSIGARCSRSWSKKRGLDVRHLIAALCMSYAWASVLCAPVCHWKRTDGACCFQKQCIKPPMHVVGAITSQKLWSELCGAVACVGRWLL